MERKKKILVVEDDIGSRKLILLILGAAYDLIEAANGAEAIDRAHASEPLDLIIIDLELPDVTGDKVIRQLKDDPSTRDIPVVVLSADALTAQRRELLAAGARDYLTKPVDVKELLRIVDDAIESGQR